MLTERQSHSARVTGDSCQLSRLTGESRQAGLHCLAEVYIRPSSGLKICSITPILLNYSSTCLLNKFLLIPSFSPSDGLANKSSLVVSFSTSLFALRQLLLLHPRCHKSRVAIKIGWATSLNLLGDPTSQSVQTIHMFKSVWIISKTIRSQLASKTSTPITDSVTGIRSAKSYLSWFDFNNLFPMNSNASCLESTSMNVLLRVVVNADLLQGSGVVSLYFSSLLFVSLLITDRL